MALLALLLAVNVMGLQFDAWSHLPALRGLYASACGVADCEQRFLADIYIDGDTTAHRLGPPEQLALSTVLVNRAELAQRFPILAVRLLAADGKQLGARRITPAGYLERGASRSMAPNKPTPVTLRINDPGDEAVSYAITVQ